MPEPNASSRDHSARRARRDLRGGRAGGASRRRGPARRRRRRHRQLGRACQDRQLAARRPGSDGARGGGGRDGPSGRAPGGTVAAAGPGVAELREGDEVMTHPLPLRRHGAWAGRVLAPAATIAPRPPEASWEACGAFPIPALTAAQALDEALGIESGGWVVVNGAGGVTGGLLVQLAAARGAPGIATASAKKAERIRDYGASEVLDYHGDWPALVREITGGGAPKAVNAARGQAATTLKAVADGGRLATITGDPPPEERGVAVSDVYVRPDGRQLSALSEMLAQGALSVPIASVRPLEQAAQGLREAVAGADGAVVLSL